MHGLRTLVIRSKTRDDGDEIELRKSLDKVASKAQLVEVDPVEIEKYLP